MQNTSISLVSLDFDTIKTSLKTYLKSQDRFKDYDFDGSNMSVLLDILAYNTYKNAFYLNMVAAESFLDSAQIRDSVVSKAKELNYTPRSRKSSVAKLNLQFPQSGLQTFVIPTGTRFSGQNSNSTYSYVSNQAVILYPSGGYFTTTDYPIYEGRFLTEAYVMDYSVERQRFLLSNPQIDTDSLTITVSEDNGITFTEYTPAVSLFDLTANSTVFFIQSAENNKYEVVFGDGVLGKRPMDSSIIRAQYRVTNGADGNGSTNFVLDDNLGTVNGLGNAVVPTIVSSAAYGGAERESIDSIRYNAPRHYETQERAITTNDFKALLLNQFTNIKAVNIYGGEDVKDSVRYGRVYIVPVTYSGVTLTTNEKSDIEKYLKDRTVLGITPYVIDPETLYLVVNSNVNYDKKYTSLTPTDIASIVKSAIETYNVNSLLDFNIEFLLSDFTTMIDNSYVAISSNETKIQLKKISSIGIDKSAYIAIEYNNKIIPGTVISSEFSSNGRIYRYTDYNPNNNTLSIVQNANGTTIINSSKNMYLCDITAVGQQTYTVAGTIDYEIGHIDLNLITINSFNGNPGVEFYATPIAENIKAGRNDLLTIDVEYGINVIAREE